MISIIAVIIAATNQVFVLLGKSPMLIDSTLIEQLLSAIFTIITVLIAWVRRKKAYMAKPKKKKSKKKELIQILEIEPVKIFFFTGFFNASFYKFRYTKY